MRGAVTRHSKLNADNKPNLNEALFVKRDLPPDHPDVVAGLPFRGTNQWPDGICPACATRVVAYCDAMEALANPCCRSMRGRWTCRRTGFAAASRPRLTLRMSHYPPEADPPSENEFGLAPHSDTSFMTLLAQNRVPGLSIRLPNGQWIEPVAARQLPGQRRRPVAALDQRPLPRHPASCRQPLRAGALCHPVLLRLRLPHPGWIACPPARSDNPPRYPPITYAEYLAWYRDLDYAAKEALSAG